MGVGRHFMSSLVSLVYLVANWGGVRKSEAKVLSKQLSPGHFGLIGVENSRTEKNAMKHLHQKKGVHQLLNYLVSIAHLYYYSFTCSNTKINHKKELETCISRESNPWPSTHKSEVHTARTSRLQRSIYQLCIWIISHSHTHTIIIVFF